MADPRRSISESTKTCTITWSTNFSAAISCNLACGILLMMSVSNSSSGQTWAVKAWGALFLWDPATGTSRVCVTWLFFYEISQLRPQLIGEIFLSDRIPPGHVCSFLQILSWHENGANLNPCSELLKLCWSRFEALNCFCPFSGSSRYLDYGSRLWAHVCSLFEGVKLCVPTCWPPQVVCFVVRRFEVIWCRVRDFVVIFVHFVCSNQHFCSWLKERTARLPCHLS